jgi:pimeloyl-ACP methyl ester carboxylesterase
MYRLFSSISVVQKVALLVSLLAVVSCSRDGDPFADNEYLLSAEKVFTTQAASITTLLTLISSSEPEIAALMDYVEHDVDVYRVTYSTMVYDQDIIASGLICVPATSGSYPVLSFQNGTNTVHANAPSVNPSSFSYQLIENLASMGFIVLIPDYPGFGSSDDMAHPYLLKEPTVRSVADMLGALREFDTDVAHRVNITDDLYLFGYSQGGWATLALHDELEANGTSGFRLKGSAAGAGPADLKGMLVDFTGDTEYPMPSYFAYIAHAYHTYNRFATSYGDIFNEPYASRIPTLFNGMLSIGAINEELTTDLGALLRSEFRVEFATGAAYADVRQALDENSIVPWSTSVPLLLVHGESDTQVPPEGTVALYDAMIDAGTEPSVLEIVLIPDADHGSGLIPASVESLIFLIGLTGNR